MTRRLKSLRSLIRSGVTGCMNHEINNKTLYAIIAVALSIFTVSTLKYFPFLGGTAQTLSPSLVIDVLFHDIPFTSKII